MCLFKVKKVMFFSFILAFFISQPALAKTTVWKNPSYDFEQVKTITVKTPVFFYNYIDNETDKTNESKLSTDVDKNVEHKVHAPDENHFEKYPNSQNIIMSILEKQVAKLPQYKFIYESAENTAAAQMQPAKPTQATAKPPQATAASDVSSAATQDGGLVLSIKITDFGWYCNNNKNRWSIQKDTSPFAWGSRGSSNSQNEANTPNFVINYTHHSSKYNVTEFAIADFTLFDAKTGEQVWTYTDYKSRESDEKAFQKNWPESMMTGIFSDAFKKMPFVGK